MQTQQYKLRLATYLDVPKLLVAAQKGFKDSPYAGKLIYSESRAEKMINMLLELGHNKSIILFAEDVNGDVVAVIAAMVFYTQAGAEEVVSEQLWWVDKLYRKSRLAITLVEGLEFWAKKLGIRHVILGSMENEHSGSVEKFYNRKGYIKTESTFVKEIQK